MPLPEGLAAAERWPVQGRQGWKIHERLNFGPYAAEDVDRSWTRGRDREVALYEGNDREQHYSFVLNEQGSATWLVKCRSGLEKRMVATPAVDVNLKNRSNLDCAITVADGSETWLLTLTESNERPLEGFLENGSRRFDVRGTNALEGSLPVPQTSGYHISDGTRVVGAVEVVNNGAVVLDGSLDVSTRSMLSAAATALLLLEELRTSLEA